MGFGEQAPGSNIEVERNRVLELIDNKYLDNQIESGKTVGNKKRMAILEQKRNTFTGFIVESLADEFYAGDKQPDDIVNDLKFREYVSRVRKERIIKMLEVKKMQFEEALEVEKDPKNHEFQLIYLDAVDELISEFER